MAKSIEYKPILSKMIYIKIYWIKIYFRNIYLVYVTEEQICKCLVLNLKSSARESILIYYSKFSEIKSFQFLTD